MPYRYRSRRQTRKSKFPFKLILGIIGVIVVVVGLFVFRGQLSNISLQSNQPNGSLVTSVKDYLADFVGPDKGVRQYIDSLLAGGSFTKSGDTNIVTQENPQTRVGKIAVISDSHASNETFDKVMSRIIAEEVDMVIHLGDVSKGGEISELEGIKDILDQSKLEYYVLPGDHDYNWLPEHDLRNYRAVFGEHALDSSIKIIGYNGMTFVLLDNSGKSTSNKLVLELLEAIDSGLASSDIFLFTVSPFTNPYFETKQDSGGEEILSALKTLPIKQIFSGDTHIFSRYTDEESGITTTTVGATGDYKNPLPQYVIVDFYSNGDFDIKSKPAVDLESVD